MLMAISVKDQTDKNSHLQQGEPTPLSPAEKRLQAKIDGIYADLWISDK